MRGLDDAPDCHAEEVAAGRQLGHAGWMEPARIADVVEWTIDPQTPTRRFGAALRNILVLGDTVARAATGGDTTPELHPVRDPRVPTRPDQPVGTITIRGTAPWIPEPATDQDLTVTLYPGAADVAAHPGSGIPTPIDLATLHIIGATPARGTAHHRLEDTWKLVLSGPDTHLTATGTWINLAWAAHLGHWPQP